ncbi:MAG: hypothetical protein HYX90_08275 [Chloroflexi bacterium]|nr:hypothetical protein [Chloroflexota bacterium]
MTDAITSTEPNGVKGDKVVSPPYISWVTFKGFIGWLETEKIPIRFDRSFWDKKYSGSTGVQLMAALRFLGLLVDDKPQIDLHSLVEAKDDARKAILKDIIKKRYATVNFDHLKAATPSMVDEWFRAYPALGPDALRKAESFFINACKEADVGLSRSVSKKARIRMPKAKTGGARSRNGGQSQPEGKAPAMEPPALKPDDGSRGLMTTRIELASQGSATLVLDVDLFGLSEYDRNFVLKLVDIARGYNKEGEGLTAKATQEE